MTQACNPTTHLRQNGSTCGPEAYIGIDSQGNYLHGTTTTTSFGPGGQKTTTTPNSNYVVYSYPFNTVQQYSTLAAAQAVTSTPLNGAGSSSSVSAFSTLPTWSYPNMTAASGLGVGGIVSAMVAVGLAAGFLLYLLVAIHHYIERMISSGGRS